MDRISGPNYANVGGLRMWQDRNPAAGTAGTFGNAAWFNGVQEELINVMAQANIQPNAGSNTQVFQALAALFGTAFGSGWRQINGGMILQWGTSHTVTGQLDPVYFPIAYPNAPLVTLANEANVSGFGSPCQPTIYGVGASPNPKNYFLLSGARVLSSGASVYESNIIFSFLSLGY